MTAKHTLEVAELLVIKSVLYNDIEMYDQAVHIIGQEYVTRYKIDNNLRLFKQDFDFLIDRILSE